MSEAPADLFPPSQTLAWEQCTRSVLVHTGFSERMPENRLYAPYLLIRVGVFLHKCNLFFTRLLFPKEVNIFKEQKYSYQKREPNLWPCARSAGSAVTHSTSSWVTWALLPSGFGSLTRTWYSQPYTLWQKVPCWKTFAQSFIYIKIGFPEKMLSVGNICTKF